MMYCSTCHKVTKHKDMYSWKGKLAGKAPICVECETGRYEYGKPGIITLKETRIQKVKRWLEGKINKPIDVDLDYEIAKSM